jgi:hypothetical protein
MFSKFNKFREAAKSVQHCKYFLSLTAMKFAKPNKLLIIGDQKAILAHFCPKLARKGNFFAQYFGEIIIKKISPYSRIALRSSSSITEDYTGISLG